MPTQLEQRLDGIRALADSARDSLDSALFQIAAVAPLLTSSRIIQPLDNTYAAHTLSMLQWTLYSHAVINLCKALFDGDPRSGSVAAVMRKLEDQDLLSALRTKRTEPTPAASPCPKGVDRAEWKEIDRQCMERRRREDEAWFDAELPKLRALYGELQSNDVAKRLRTARNKFLAHADIRLDGEGYVAARPEDFGLRWGDPSELASLAMTLIEKLFIVAFGHGLALAQTKQIFEDYSSDFWGHLEAGLEVSQPAPDKPVRERPRI